MKTSFLQILRSGLAAALLAVLSVVANAQVSSVPVSSLPANAKIALCGDSITEQMLYTKYVEIYLRACAGRTDVSCFQFGWGGENAAQFPVRINRGDLDAFGPTVVTFLYGANDVGGLAWDGSWMTGMWTGRVNGILDALASKYPSLSAKIICAPTFFDANSPGANAASINQSNVSLGNCRDIDRSVAVSRGVNFSDVRQRMLESGTAARTGIGSGYYLGGNDGVHAGPNGHLMIAHEILKALSCTGTIGTISVNFAGSASATTGHSIVSASGGVVVIDSLRYPFCTNYNGSTASDRMATILPYLPFSQELNRFMLVVTNLTSASANVTWGSTTLTFSKAELEAGVNLAERFSSTPFDSKFASVMALIETKQQKEQQMIKAAGDATAPNKGWTAADVLERNALDANVAAAITAVRHTITIAPVGGGGAAPVITGTNATSGTVGSAFSFQVTASNLPTSYSATGLPAGLNINPSSGMISGTPSSAGTNTVMLSASNSYGTGTAMLNITISAAQATPVVTSAPAASGTVGAAFSYQITATNSPTKYYATGLPGGLNLNATTGAVTGTPTAAGTTSVLVSAENAGGNGSAVTLVITISEAGGGGGGTDVIVDEFSTATSQYGTPLTNSGTVGAPGLAPSGANLPGGTWLLAGGGVYDSYEYPGSNAYIPGVSYATGHNGGAAAITLGSYNVSGTLMVQSSLSFSGSAATGSFALVGFYSAPKTGEYQSLSSNFSGLKVNYDGSLQLYVGGSAVGSAVAFGGSYNPSAFSTLKFSVNTSTGAISAVSFGASTAAYNFSTSGFTSTATAYAGIGGTMGNSPSAVVFDNFKVSTGGGGGQPQVPVITSSLTASGAVGTAFSYQITANNSPTLYRATGLPAGLSLNVATGALTGTPTTAGTSNVSISASNGAGNGSAATLVITITAAGGGGGGADVIVDEFSAATSQYGTPLTNSGTVGAPGLAPSGANLPGGTWLLAGGGVYDSYEYPSSNTYIPGVSYATGHNGGAAAIRLGSYNVSGTLTVQSSLSFSGSAAAGSYALVGFYSGPKTSQYQSLTTAFSGLKVNHDGSLQLYVGGSIVGSAVAFVGSYNPSAFSTLKFSVNTSTGAISAVSFGASTAAYNFSTSGFTSAATAYAGIGGTMGNSPSAVVFDNFKVSTGGGGGPPQVPVITSSLTASGAVGTAFTYQVTANNSPTLYQATGLSPGLSVNTATGALTGTPTTAGTSNVTISASNAAGNGAAATLVITIAGGGGGGTDIVFDEFSSAASQYGTPLTNSTTVGGTGLAPSEANLPSGTWQLAGGGTYDSNEYPASNAYVPGVSYATGHNGGAVAITLGSFNLSRSLTVRSNFLFSGSAASGSYALVGFYTAPKTSQYQALTANFTGLQVNYDGSIQLYVNGSPSGSAIAFGGTYNPAMFSSLTFTVNTSTGAISGVSFGSSSATYLFSTTGFTNAATAYAGFGGTMGNSPSAVVFDTFKVSTP